MIHEQLIIDWNHGEMQVDIACSYEIEERWDYEGNLAGHYDFPDIEIDIKNILWIYDTKIYPIQKEKCKKDFLQKLENELEGVIVKLLIEGEIL